MVVEIKQFLGFKVTSVGGSDLYDLSIILLHRTSIIWKS